MSHNILVIEDSKHIIMLLQRFLKILPAKHNWYFGESIADLKQQLRERNFDLILCDINLPDGDSSELVPGLKADTPHTHYLAYTSHEANDIENSDGFDGFIAKSTDPLNVLEHCEKLVTEKANHV